MASKFPPEHMKEQPETLLEFPCKFPIKAMGRDIDGFKELVEDMPMSFRARKLPPIPAKQANLCP